MALWEINRPRYILRRFMRKALKDMNWREENRKIKKASVTKNKHQEEPTSNSNSSDNINLKPLKPLYTPSTPLPKKLSSRIQYQRKPINKIAFIIDVTSQTDSFFS